jgi:dipeptidyl aminopeptidase/acylaminoacyl peptidase
MIGVACIVACHAAHAAAQSTSAPQPDYKAAMAAADSIYERSNLALTSDGQWLAISRSDRVEVVRTSGGRAVRVPLPSTAKSCRELMWNARGNTLAMMCAGDVLGISTLFTWRRGASTVYAIGTASIHGNTARWVNDTQLQYAIMPNALPVKPRPAPPPQDTRAEWDPGCVPATVANGEEAVSILCSDTVDVLRSAALGAAVKSDSTKKAARSRPADTTLVHVIIAGPQHPPRTIARLRGRPVVLRASADGNRVYAIMIDRVGLAMYSVYALDRKADSGSVATLEPTIRNVPMVLNGATVVSSPDVSAIAWWPRFVEDLADTLYLAALARGAQPVRIALPARRTDTLPIDVEPADTYSNLDNLPRPVWTPDGTRVLIAVRGRAWIVRRDSVTPRLLSDSLAPQVVNVISATNRDALALAVERSTGRKQFWWVDLESGRWGLAADFAHSQPVSLVATHDDATTTVAYVASTRTSPSNVYTTRLTRAMRLDTEPRRVTNARLNVAIPQFRDTVLSYEVTPGVIGTSYLMRPVMATGSLPTIVYAYPGGGASSLRAHRFKSVDGDFDAYSALARGYAVLFPDIPMTPLGVYGKRGPAAEIVDGISAALAAATPTGWMDTTRLGVIGHSYGGYMVNVLVTRMPERFAAAVSLSGSSDLVSQVYGGIGYSENMFFVTGQGRMAAKFADDPARYLENSPVRYLHRVKTPLLLVHGEIDWIVNIQQSEEMFRGLSRLGKPVELVRYHNRGHGLDTAGWQRGLDWFDKYLR